MAQACFWFMQQSSDISAAMSRALRGDTTIGVPNAEDIGFARYRADISKLVLPPDARKLCYNRAPLLPGSPHLFISLPRRNFAPDFLIFGPYSFASRRLRDALALPERIVQYWPVELLAGTVEAEAQDYRWMRVLPVRLAMDWARSVCKFSIMKGRNTGHRLLIATRVKRFAVKPGLRPAAELFWAAENCGPGPLATDALAERVLRAGCTGVAFQDPRTARIYQGIKLYRTADGVRERDTRPEANPPRRARRRVSGAS